MITALTILLFDIGFKLSSKKFDEGSDFAQMIIVIIWLACIMIAFKQDIAIIQLLNRICA